MSITPETIQSHEIKPETTRNFNNPVLIKVTEIGEQIWDDYHREARILLKDPNAFPLQRDDDGYTRMRLYDVASIFGPAMHAGVDLPIETEFKFE